MTKIEQYDDMLDECHGPVKMGSFEWDASRILKKMDPIAYRCGFNDWLDSEGEDAHKEAEDDGSFDRLP